MSDAVMVNLSSRPGIRISILMSCRPSRLFTIPNLRCRPNIKLINYSPRLPHNSLINKKKASAVVCSCDPGLPSNRSCPDVMH